MSSCSAASRREAPPSTRAITRMRMSAEYAFGIVRPPDESMPPDSPTYRSLGTLRFYSARTCSSCHSAAAPRASRAAVGSAKNKGGNDARSAEGRGRRCGRDGYLRPRPRAGLSHPHRHSRCALSARRRRRRHGARRRGETCRRARPASRGRQPRRRLRPRRHARLHQKPARRLHAGHTESISINPSLYANAGFDPRKDFAPIGLIASMPVALLAHPSFPAKTIGDVVTIAKTAGANFNIGTSAVGTGGYLTAELFKSVTGIDAAIIPYKGTAQVMNDLLGNHVPI